MLGCNAGEPIFQVWGGEKRGGAKFFQNRRGEPKPCTLWYILGSIAYFVLLIIIFSKNFQYCLYFARYQTEDKENGLLLLKKSRCLDYLAPMDIACFEYNALTDILNDFMFNNCDIEPLDKQITLIKLK